jgi:hypothetical protein
MSWKENPQIKQLTPISGWTYVSVWSDQGEFSTDVMPVVALAVVSQEYSDGVEDVVQAIVYDRGDRAFVRTSELVLVNVVEVGLFAPGETASQDQIDAAIEKLKRKLQRKAA